MKALRVIILLGVLGFGAAYLFWDSKEDQMVDKIKKNCNFEIQTGTGLYAATHNEEGVYSPEDYSFFASVASGENHTPLSQIPNAQIDAITSTEDHTFYTHSGIRPARVVKAVLDYFTGGTRSGASTITMQLARTLPCTGVGQEKTTDRKLIEISAAQALEQELSKPRILELYLNRVYLGNVNGKDVRGVTEAARAYYNKPLSALSLAECAHIAGMLQNPGKLYPSSSNPNQGIDRRNQVLAAMLKHNKISTQEYNQAKQMPSFGASSNFEAQTAPFFRDYILKQFPTCANCRIETTLDPDIQAIVVNVMQSAVKEKSYDNIMIVVLTRHGEVLSATGKKYLENSYSPFSMRRQTGSSVKPFIYLSALLQGLTLADRFKDEVMDLGGYAPENYGGGASQELLSIYQAFQKSTNTVAVQVFQLPGVAEQYHQLMEKMNLKVDPSIKSLALGSQEQNLVGFARRYAMLINHGNYPGLRVVRRLTDLKVNSSQDFPVQETPVITPVQAELGCRLLQAYFLAGGNLDHLAGQYEHGVIGGKTGTTQDGKDAWFMGVTPEVVVGVWLTKANQEVVGGADAAPIGVKILNQVVKLRPHLGGNSWGSGEGLVEKRVCDETIPFFKGTENADIKCDEPFNFNTAFQERDKPETGFTSEGTSESPTVDSVRKRKQKSAWWKIW